MSKSFPPKELFDRTVVSGGGESGRWTQIPWINPVISTIIGVAWDHNYESVSMKVSDQQNISGYFTENLLGVRDGKLWIAKDHEFRYCDPEYVAILEPGMRGFYPEFPGDHLTYEASGFIGLKPREASSK